MNRVFIYGGSRGIGLELAKIYADEGRLVQAIGRSGHAKCEHPNLYYHQLDGTVPDLALAPEILESTYDRVWLNAAIFGPNPTDPLAIPAADLRRVLETNVVSHFALLKLLLPNITRDGSGKVVFVISKGGLHRSMTGAGAIGYRVSKAAQIALALSLAAALAPLRILTLLISPGWVRTAIGGKNAPMTVEFSASRLHRLVEQATVDMAGGIFNYDGSQIFL